MLTRCSYLIVSYCADIKFKFEVGEDANVWTGIQPARSPRICQALFKAFSETNMENKQHFELSRLSGSKKDTVF
jgi:hypothetical protein